MSSLEPPMPSLTRITTLLQGKFPLILIAWCRENCFKTTLVHLTERFNGKEVFLVGTTNMSTLLAKRTQKLIGDVQPDAVMVQTNQEWWNAVKLMGYVESQEEFNHYHKHLDKYTQL